MGFNSGFKGLRTSLEDVNLWEEYRLVGSDAVSGRNLPIVWIEHTASIYHYDGQTGTSKTLIRSLLNTRRHIRVVAEPCQAHCAWQRSATFHVWKTRGCQCSFRLLMMGGVSPETCWASYKYGIITFWYIVASCWIFFTNCTMMHGSMNIKFITPRIFTLVATLKWIFSLTPPPLYHRGNIPSHPPVMH